MVLKPAALPGTAVSWERRLKARLASSGPAQASSSILLTQLLGPQHHHLALGSCKYSFFSVIC